MAGPLVTPPVTTGEENKLRHIRFFLQLRLYLIIMLKQQYCAPVVFTIAYKTNMC